MSASIRTDKYGMPYYLQDEYTSAVDEMQRFETLDAQLYSLFAVLGNGVIEGWNIVNVDGDGNELVVQITPGSGHVTFVSVESIDSVNLALTPSTRNWIYAILTPDSYWTKNVSFASFLFEDSDSENLLLGYVDTDQNSITNINVDARQELGFRALVQDIVAAHRHIGGTGNPDPINLESEVQGIINQENLPELDASLIKSGVLDPDRFPKLSHITDITDQGELTHAQLDSFVSTLNLNDQSLMGEVSTSNLLQLVLALKHAYPEVDEYMVNEIAFIPGISPDEYIDTDNTTAIVDTRTFAEGGTHTITGTASTGLTAYTAAWNDNEDFEAGTNDNVVITGGSVCIDTQEDILVLDDFNSINNWQVLTNDVSSVSATFATDSSTYITSPTSGKLTIGSEEVNVSLLVKKTFSAEDWSSYKYIRFYLFTESVEHGDLFFYFTDDIAGTQGSDTKVLNRNSPTVNVDTLQNGWQEVTVNIENFTKDSVSEMGFYVNTQEGWDTSKGFDLNIDNVALTSGNKYFEDGYNRVRFGGATLYQFWRVRWDASIPSDAESTGILLQSRTRVANSEAGLDTAAWSDYTSVSGDTIQIPSGTLYSWIEIETYLTASDSLSRTPCLEKLYLDYYTSDVDNSFEYDSKDDWETGSLYNIDTQTTPGSIQITNLSEVGDTYYGTNGNAYQLDDNLEELYKISGFMLPRSTQQVLKGSSPSLGLVTGVAKGNNGNLWLTDVDNDRVMELETTGNLVRMYMGSFLNDPQDVYGIENFGPGSNEEVIALIESESNVDFEVLHSIYNSDTKTLYIVFSRELENIYDGDATFDINKMYLKIGTQRFYLDDSTVSLLGVSEEAISLWGTLTAEDNEFISQFKFKSHVLQIGLLGSDATFLDYMVNQKAPSVVIQNTYLCKMIGSDSITVGLLTYNYDLGTGVGENSIRVTLDGVPSTIYTTSKTYSGLAIGEHTLKVELVNGSGITYSNIEATAETTFIVESLPYSLPYLSFPNPNPNQIFSSSPVTISFNVDNFPIIASGQHIQYIIDSNPAIDYYSTEPIVIDNLEAGKHSIEMYLVDEDGNEIVYEYGRCTTEFIVGLNSNAIVKLYIDSGAIADFGKQNEISTTRLDVDVANVIISNIFAPIDVQMIPSETSSLNNGGPTILLSKLRSQSSTNGMAGAINATEYANRIAATATEESVELNNDLADIELKSLIYGTNYLDGHSVVQMDMNGNIFFTNNAAKFANDRDQAKEILGSAEKLGNNELLIGDSLRKRAIITYTDLETQVPVIRWQYDSDRYVVDFHIVPQNDVTLIVNNGNISETSLYTIQGTTVIWKNNSSSPISIYSGKTTFEQFYLDPDLNLYGDIFSSPVLDPGDTYSFTFNESEEYDWFVYPTILTGKINVTEQRISSRDDFVILENDGTNSAFSSRAIKVDSWGNVIWSFGESYLVNPRDARPLVNGNVLVST